MERPENPPGKRRKNRPASENDFETARLAITRYVNSIAGKLRLKIGGRKGIMPHISMLAAMMVDNHVKAWRINDNPEHFIWQFVNGKRFLEAGGRNAHFLRFLQHHGAKVLCATGGEHLEEARAAIGAENVVDARMEELGDLQKVRDFKPQFIFNVNLFAQSRWKKGFPAARILRSLSRIASPHTQVYVWPAKSETPVFTEKDLRKVRGIEMHEKGARLPPFKVGADHIHRFRYNPRKK